MVVFYPPSDFFINLSDTVDPSTVQTSDLTVNGTPANSFTLQNGNTQIMFHFNTPPEMLGTNTCISPLAPLTA
jgi:hypothetical protein